MNDVTEIQGNKHSNATLRLTVTPVLQETALTSPDISLTTKQESGYDLQKWYGRTLLSSEYEALFDRNTRALSEENSEIFNSTNDVSEDRLTLLARKYVNKEMLPEDSARLDILTQRFRNMMSGVTENDLQIMDSINTQLSSALELNDELQKKYK